MEFRLSLDGGKGPACLEMAKIRGQSHLREKKTFYFNRNPLNTLLMLNK
jgi:hypothetical protein